MASQLQKTTFDQLKDRPHRHRVVIVGAGIVGSALASLLSVHESLQVVLIDRSLDPLQGSTGQCSRLCRQLNQDSSLCRLAVSSVNAYCEIPEAFDRVGGLEIATTDEEAKKLQSRLNLAHAADLKAGIISTERAIALAPHFVRSDNIKAALHFPDDGTARADVITTSFRAKAKANGTLFLECLALKIIFNAQNDIVGLQTGLGVISASNVIFATGIWTSSLLSQYAHLPIIPVSHPYIKSAPRARRSISSPFVRYPSFHAYIRDHGSFDGMGSYDHEPMPTDPGPTAVEPSFTTYLYEPLHRAQQSLLPDKNLFEGGTAFSGVFAVTPDNLPLAGKIAGAKGLWVVAAVWVTHALGTAQVVADMVLREEGIENVKRIEQLEHALDPNRFEGVSEDELKKRALKWYKDVGKYLS